MDKETDKTTIKEMVTATDRVAHGIHIEQRPASSMTVRLNTWGSNAADIWRSHLP